MPKGGRPKPPVAAEEAIAKRPLYKIPIHDVTTPQEVGNKLEFKTPSGRTIRVFRKSGFDPQVTTQFLSTFRKVVGNAWREGKVIDNPTNKAMREWSRHLEVEHSEGDNISLYYTAPGSVGRSVAATEGNPHLAPESTEELEARKDEYNTLEYLRAERDIRRLDTKLKGLLEHYKPGVTASEAIAAIDNIEPHALGTIHLDIQETDANLEQRKAEQDALRKKLTNPAFGVDLNHVKRMETQYVVDNYNNIIDHGVTGGDKPAPFSKEEIDTALKSLPDALKGTDLVRVLVRYGQKADTSYLAELYVPKEWSGKIGRFFRNNFFPLLPGDEHEAPDGRIVYVPNVKGMKKKMVLRDPLTQTGFILGGESEEERIDYNGEAKKCAMEMFQNLWMMQGRGIGLHAATKAIQLLDAEGNIIHEVGLALLGGSGTGKSTTAGHPHSDTNWLKALQMMKELGRPYTMPSTVQLAKLGVRMRVLTKQDDMVRLSSKDLSVHPDEHSYYFKTIGIDKDQYQKEILDAIMTGDEVIAENIDLDDHGKFLLSSDRLTANGRAQVARSDLPISDLENPTLNRLDVIVMNRRGPLYHPVEKVQDPLDAVGNFALGKTIQTKGTVVPGVGEREVEKRIMLPAFNPFIVRGYHTQYFGTMFNILKNNRQIKQLMLNTGSKGRGRRAEPISVKTTIRCIEAGALADGDWKHSPVTHTIHAVNIPGVEMDRFKIAEVFPSLESYEQDRKEDMLSDIKYLRLTFPQVPDLMLYADRLEDKLTGTVTSRADWEKDIKHLHV